VRLRPSSDLNTEYLALVRSMLQRGAQVAAVNQKLETPLHIACIRGGVALVDLLLQNGAPINAVNESGETGLHCSVRCGNLPIAKCLLRANATPDIESSSGTPIEMALDTERPDIARMIQGIELPLSCSSCCTRSLTDRPTDQSTAACSSLCRAHYVLCHNATTCNRHIRDRCTSTEQQQETPVTPCDTAAESLASHLATQPEPRRADGRAHAAA